MKSAWIVAVVVCVVLASSVFASGVGTLSLRATAMGGAVTGMADDGSAWFQNAAGLGALNLQPQEGKLWANDAIAGYADFGSDDAWGLTWSGWQPAKALGVGAGYANTDWADILGAGVGIGIKNLPLSVGLSVYNQDPSSGSDTTYLDLGLMYQFAQPEKAPIRLGLVARDLTDEDQTTFDIGVAWPAAPNWLVAVDVKDLTDEYDTLFCGGVEYTFGQTAEWAARAGLTDDGSDNNLTLGVGYKFKNNWRVDAAWVDGDVDDTWGVSAGIGF